jgi:hypothetical protein
VTGRFVLTAGLALASTGCLQQDLEAPATLAKVDEAFFRCRVQPVLATTCAFFVCHGDGRRPFRVYARNRLRLGKTELTRNEPLTTEERQANFAAARAFVDPEHPADSLLLSKPLDRDRAQGRFHRGAEIFGGGDVFPSREDPDFRVLLRWAEGATADAACIEPGSEL